MSGETTHPVRQTIEEAYESDCGLDPGGLGEGCRAETDACPECGICQHCAVDGHDEGCSVGAKPASTPIEYTPPEPNAALVVGPNDHLVIALPADVTHVDVDRFLSTLRERGLRDRVTIVAGAKSIAVLRDAAPVPMGALSMHPESWACASCFARWPERFARFPTVCQHVAAERADAVGREASAVRDVNWG